MAGKVAGRRALGDARFVTYLILKTEVDEIVLFNPGSFDGRRGGSPRSVGILTLGEAISGQIIYL